MMKGRQIMNIIDEYKQRFFEETRIDIRTPIAVFSFGNTPQMADELALLVATGKKTGTSSGYALYAGELPSLGERGIVLDGKGVPVCIIKNTKIEIVAFKDITENHARKEGEGDQSLAYWRKVHFDFFEKSFYEQGMIFDENELIVYEEFEVIYH